MKPISITQCVKNLPAAPRARRLGHPMIDCYYKAGREPTEGSKSDSAPVPAASERASFRDLSREYSDAEKTWTFVIESLLFAVLVAISAWPIHFAVAALRDQMPL